MLRCGGELLLGYGRHRRRLLRPPLTRAKSGGRYGHQRQDHHRNAALRPVSCYGLPRGIDLDGGLSNRPQGDTLNPHHTRRSASAGYAARDGRLRLRVLLYGGLVALAGAGSRARAGVLRCGLHQPHARPFGLSRHLQGVYPRQEAALRPSAEAGLCCGECRRSQWRGRGAELPRPRGDLLAATDGHLPLQGVRDALRRYAAAPE